MSTIFISAGILIHPLLSILVHSTTGIKSWSLVKYLNRLREILVGWIMAQMCIIKEYHLDDELKIALEDLESVESKNEELKENVKVANECVQKPRE